MIGPSTRVLTFGWLLKTRTFVKVMLPGLLTNPPKTTELPAVTGPGGQVSVRLMAGVERIGQVTETVFVTAAPVLESMPVTVRVSLLAQVLRRTG